MRVVITDEAYSDLAAIMDFVGLQNPHRALSFVDELIERCKALGNMPLAFPIVGRYRAHDVRRCVYHGYLIFYRVRPIAVEVLHVVQGARDFEALLFPDGSAK